MGYFYDTTNGFNFLISLVYDDVTFSIDNDGAITYTKTVSSTFPAVGAYVIATCTKTSGALEVRTILFKRKSTDTTFDDAFEKMINLTTLETIVNTLSNDDIADAKYGAIYLDNNNALKKVGLYHYVNGSSSDTLLLPDTSGSKLYLVGKKGTTSGEIFNDYSNNTADGFHSHAEGSHTTTTLSYCHVEGLYSRNFNMILQSVGTYLSSDYDKYYTFNGSSDSPSDLANLNKYEEVNLVDGDSVNGYYKIQEGVIAHAEGAYTTASGTSSHAEGDYTTASGTSSHAEGTSTAASGSYSHAEGAYTTASGTSSHAEGTSTTASGSYSHASGIYTTANGEAQFVIGKYNATDTTSLFIIGNGTTTGNRSNALTVDGNGCISVKQSGYSYYHGNKANFFLTFTSGSANSYYPILSTYNTTNNSSWSFGRTAATNNNYLHFVYNSDVSAGSLDVTNNAIAFAPGGKIYCTELISSSNISTNNLSSGNITLGTNNRVIATNTGSAWGKTYSSATLRIDSTDNTSKVSPIFCIKFHPLSVTSRAAEVDSWSAGISPGDSQNLYFIYNTGLESNNLTDDKNSNYKIRFSPDGVITATTVSATTLNGTLSGSSDRNVKNNIDYFPIEYENFYDNLKPLRFKYNNDESQKYRNGFIAQDVDEAFTKAGIDRNEQLLITYYNEPQEEDGSQWSICITDFIALNTWQIQKLKDEVKALKEEIKFLKEGN